jgi:hypothetical protein
MYDLRTREAAMSLLRGGQSLRAISIATGINRSTLRDWRDNGIRPRTRDHGCSICLGGVPGPPLDYLYLLGLYLGDGCISEAARTTALRISCADAWPGLADDCARSLESVSGRRAYRVSHQGCHEILALWQHWPCLFPQHGRGKKHERKIVLAPWQRTMVESDPRPLIRGLIHSDGWRGTNWTERRVGGTVKRYTYPRYQFTNESADIKRIFTDALDLLGISWRVMNRKTISVARREAVAAMDVFVGPKY